jgi:hypothetical protein
MLDTIYPIANPMFTDYLMNTSELVIKLHVIFWGLLKAYLFSSSSGIGSIHRTIFG